MGQGQHRLGLPAGLGEGVGQLGLGEFLPDQRHLRRAGQQRGARFGTAPDQLGDRGVLERARRCLGPVQRAQHPDELVIGGPGEPVPGSRGVLGQAVQRGAAGGDIEGLAGGERAGRAGGLPADPPGGGGFAGAPAGRRRFAGEPGRAPGPLPGPGRPLPAGTGRGRVPGTGIIIIAIGWQLVRIDRRRPRQPLLLGQAVPEGRERLPPARTGKLVIRGGLSATAGTTRGTAGS